MRFLTSAVLIVIGVWCHAVLAENNASNSAEEGFRRMTFYQDEASKLSASWIYKGLEKQRGILAAKTQLGISEFVFDEDTYKATGYVMELERRRKENDPAASFYYGIYNWRVCSGFESGSKGQFDSDVKYCWLDSLESLKVASNAKIAEASFNIGQMYEKGWGVLSSKLVAADWYVRAAQQFNDSGSRDEALISIESALNAVHDHPAALRLKNMLLK
ncbi:MAG: hypothetical protein Q8N35_09975 [Methylococcaceae bacterium]|nr:hypothetical protein [Methylococcaceae bacterium]MDZ4155930.1 hypothetical protein [Methylococcales bacterium]MDP2392736.1 hypothetical protein [Methylococcaceae bacterium]MDP3019906.1 hypothetical protein [Methylococcaceae bacterium]MDP3389901.1 hypothetical protein [Methylococcaceae bacterium]